MPARFEQAFPVERYRSPVNRRTAESTRGGPTPGLTGFCTSTLDGDRPIPFTAAGGFSPKRGSGPLSLPENVYRLRITDGHSIDHVAEASGVPPAIVSAIENGRMRVPPKVIRALAQHFRVSEAELLK